MNFLICYCVIISYFILNVESYLAKPWYYYPHASSHIAQDKMSVKERSTVITIAKELLSEARYKARLVHKIRQKYQNALSYEVGLIMGKIRERYKRMMEIYHLVIVRHKGKFTLLPPMYLYRMYTVYYIKHLENIRLLQLEIDNLVEILESIDIEGREDEIKEAVKAQMIDEAIKNQGKGTPHRRFADDAKINFTGIEALNFKTNILRKSRRKIDRNVTRVIQNAKDDNMTFLEAPRKVAANRPRQVKRTTSTIDIVKQALTNPIWLPKPTLTPISDTKETHQLTQEDIKRRYRQKFFAEQQNSKWTANDNFGF